MAEAPTSADGGGLSSQEVECWMTGALALAAGDGLGSREAEVRMMEAPTDILFAFLISAERAAFVGEPADTTPFLNSLLAFSVREADIAAFLPFSIFGFRTANDMIRS